MYKKRLFLLHTKCRNTYILIFLENLQTWEKEIGRQGKKKKNIFIFLELIIIKGNNTFN